MTHELTIYDDVIITVYTCVSYDNAGQFEYEYMTVYLEPEADPFGCGGEYLFYVDGEEIVICGTVGNANEPISFEEYDCYAAYRDGKQPVRKYPA